MTWYKTLYVVNCGGVVSTSQQKEYTRPELPAVFVILLMGPGQ